MELGERLGKVLGGDPWVLVLLSGRLPRPLTIDEAMEFAGLLRADPISDSRGKLIPAKTGTERLLGPPEWEV